MSEKSGATSDKNVEQAHWGNYEGIRQRLVKGEKRNADTSFECYLQ